MAVTIGPTSSNPINMELSIRQRVNTPAAQKISQELNAGGRVAVAERAFQTALGHISKLLAEKNIQVSTIFDSQNGNQVRIMDGDSGRLITQLPPNAVIQIAQRSKERNIGWIVNKLL
ncbi:flagellar protein FlaG [Desulfosporosinus sp.]|uniref:flagellar protein FlaG n=1 Tax=Desulfosporosinus sp. TaxID=157907 RepID=UPI0025C65226|nr:flagellar protein FlaG [Desulfosporosinus sp.]MBC2723825.1 flagellar protein FlaG [Desulfosporosinus sp.]MBC2728848.1 flagellar protein FlaG [Desulfosporosinus sp.]